MQMGSLAKIIFGVYFLITGIPMVVFHKDLKKIVEGLFAGMPEGVRQLPGGKSLTAVIIVTGSVSVLAGLALLLIYFLPA